MKQTRPSSNRFRHAGSKRGSSFTGIFNLSKALQYVILMNVYQKEKYFSIF